MQTLPISPSIKNLGYSVIREMSGLAARMENVITLGIGEPDFNTPEAITQKALRDARNGHTHYTPSQGDPELIDKLSRTISVTTGIPTPPSSIIITHGGMGSLTAAFRTILEPGDQVILIEPHFPDYLAHITFAGGIAVTVPSRLEDSFIPRTEDIENAITPRTRVIVLNSPNNPTGSIIPGDLLDEIARIAIRHNLVVISDEVYDQILYKKPFESIYTRPGMSEHSLIIKSFSKSYAMTGWRVGYSYGPQVLIEQMLKVVNYSTACASSIGQRAAIAALDIDQAILEKMKNRFAARVELVSTRLGEMSGVRVSKPGGSFYVFADISQITQQSRAFAIQLLQKKKVVVVPGYAFGKSGEGCIRIACTRNMSLLEEAMDRIEDFIEWYQKG